MQGATARPYSMHPPRSVRQCRPDAVPRRMAVRRKVEHDAVTGRRAGDNGAARSAPGRDGRGRPMKVRDACALCLRGVRVRRPARADR
jgi:hypothetical protein